MPWYFIPRFLKFVNAKMCVWNDYNEDLGYHMASNVAREVFPL